MAASDEAINKAFAGYLPTATVSGDSGVERSNTPARRTAGQDVYTRGRETYKLDLRQNLFDGGATASRYAVANAQRDIATYALETTRQTAIQEGILAYLNVLRQTRLVELAKATELNIKRQLNLEDERVKRGSGIAVDVLQAKSRLQLSKEKRVAYEGALGDAESRYAQVFGHPPEVKSMVLPTPPIDSLPKDLGEAVEVAGKENPSLLSTDKQIDVDREKRDGARAGFLPTVNLVVENNYESDVSTVIGVKRDSQVLVKASWDLFNGFGTTSGVAQAALEYGATQDKSLQTRRKVTEATRFAWQALLTARKRMGLLENAMNIAAEVFEARKKLREAGKENVINVLDAENEVSNTRINFTGAAFDARQATYQLLGAMGRLRLDKALVAPGTPEVLLPIAVQDVVDDGADDGKIRAPSVPLPGDIDPPSRSVPAQIPGIAPPEGVNPFDAPDAPAATPSPFDQPPLPKASPRTPVTPAPLEDSQGTHEVMPLTEEPFDTLPVIETKPGRAKPAPVKPAPKPPVVETPVSKPPVTEKPAPKPPVVETPAPKPPVAEKPVSKPPVAEKPKVGRYGVTSDNPFDKPFVPQ